MVKQSRHSKILELIEKENIGTQEDLTQRLTEEGFNVSQSTVSRDIKVLNLIKVEKNGVNKYVATSVNDKSLPPQIINLFKQVTISIESANNLIVVKTLSGNAGSAGMAIDEMKLPQVIGTVAGDDTLLIVAKTNSDADIILKSLRAL